ncbi:hypothetical protein GAN98_04405 [Bacteroides thetaiotaomicron]|uniref:Uncharacterized protein n=1 Tax=Bacteroides thetaiotaomicron TaxID=818 RepID=A0A6I0SH89_BACT4|nr:hypothetical protein GAN98_04405 [Bacteroides thetaiotaomicron]KAB4467442.1 hypothetical protein GAN67_04405 [Bacteroides thetaiotaomicron]KAB4477460.1 hypothetical protein GAN76_04405 [Bacteroides thetaiotaomicron]KAB4479242.1 hypothetical protein GAN59_01600 [Bacteroides thetaiotaomicron]KAB4488462.1 hypothetical protein GAN57_04430 [Bacteroides thetaiotaomicron]
MPACASRSSCISGWRICGIPCSSCLEGRFSYLRKRLLKEACVCNSRKRKVFVFVMFPFRLFFLIHLICFQIKGKAACAQEVHILHNDHWQLARQMLTAITSAVNTQYDNC